MSNNLDIIEGYKQGSPGRIAFPIVEKLLTRLVEAGYNLVKVNDGEAITRVTTVREALEAVFAVDEAMVYVRRLDGARLVWVEILLMNGAECISDYAAYDDGFSAVVDQALREVE